jgi:hypothetical protein
VTAAAAGIFGRLLFATAGVFFSRFFAGCRLEELLFGFARITIWAIVNSRIVAAAHFHAVKSVIAGATIDAQKSH